MTPLNDPLYNIFPRIPLQFEHGRGPWLITNQGESYLDFTSGIAVNAFGHAHPLLTRALKEQAEKLWHISNLFENSLQTQLAQRLCENSFADKVFFTNSGAEAIECAIKTARRYHYANGHAERFQIISFENAFHGRTLATSAASGKNKYLEGFGPKMAGFDSVPFDNKKALLAAITPQTAAILIEPIQGEGGVRPVADTMMQFLRQICDQHKILLIFDEVQCGIGRTGRLFAHEWSDITPDIMGIAKGIGGGFPLGACLATAEIAQSMGSGTHGSTFGGNFLAMAVGNAVLDLVLSASCLPHVRHISEQLTHDLEQMISHYPNLYSHISGKGLLLGLHCLAPIDQIIAAMREEKLLVVQSGTNIIRILPPLNITEQEIKEGITRMQKASKTLSSSLCSKSEIKNLTQKPNS